MPKPKSPKTLAKEAAWLSKFNESLVLFKENKNISRPTMDFKFKGVKNHSTHPDFIIRDVQLSPRFAASLVDLQVKLVDLGHVTKFMTEFSFGTRWTDIKYASPQFYSPPWIQGYRLSMARVGWNSTGSPEEIMGILTNYVSVDLCTAMTFPDSLGRTRVYMHKGSLLCKYKMPKVFESSIDGVSRSALKGQRHWSVLADYIKGREKAGIVPTQTAICDIVKEISLNLSKASLEQKDQLYNTINVPSE